MYDCEFGGCFQRSFGSFGLYVLDAVAESVRGESTCARESERVSKSGHVKETMAENVCGGDRPVLKQKAEPVPAVIVPVYMGFGGVT